MRTPKEVLEISEALRQRKELPKYATVSQEAAAQIRRLRWTYAVTSVDSRVNSLLPKTLESLKAGGFDKPRVFVDNYSDAMAIELSKTIGLEVVNRYPRIHTYGNWLLTLLELFIRDPHADRYAIFQDDFTCYQNLKQYLDSVKYPPQGYLNLYTFPSNEDRAPADHIGFYESNQLGRGAVALVFSNEAVSTLLKQPHIFDKPKAARKPTKSVDGAVIEALKKAGWKEYVHYPSLTQHHGEVSSMGNAKHPKSNSYKGDGFNAMDLLPKPSPGWGDHVESALTKFGITEERVSGWLGKPCGCSERKRKLNALGNWAKQFLNGTKEDAEKHLTTMIGDK